MDSESFIACHDCDLLHKRPVVPTGMSAKCCRCGALLIKPKIDSLDRTLSLAFAGIILLILANSFPFLGFELQGQVRHVLLFTGILHFYTSGMYGLAALVLFTTIIAPLSQLLTLIYILLSIKLNRPLPGIFQLFRWMQSLQPWSMMEVFMVGILVSVVKLSKTAHIITDVAAYCFMVLIFVMAACLASLDPHIVWDNWKNNKCMEKP